MNHITKTPLKLVRSYAGGKVLIDITKIVNFKLNSNYISFYSDKPAPSGAFVFGFGFWTSTNRNCVETICWGSDEEAFAELQSIQDDLNQYYNIGLVQGIVASSQNSQPPLH